ncbi:CAP domain-containing protein [Dactylosporangium sp. CA-092794]|uniref:CAP domain-containing protein n=1 Tax=Dactylosporangium sp. CA-092794 TaxID=3239929 RepID=UPI003D90C0AE
MTAPRPGLAARLGPTGIAALVAGVLILFGLGSLIIPALSDGGSTSAAEQPAAPLAGDPEPAQSSAPPPASDPEPTSAAPTTARTTLVAANFNTGYEDRVAQLINNERRKEKCDPLRVDPKLRTAARAHAADMAARDFTGARGSDGSDPAARAQAAGYASFADELTAKGGDPGDVVKHWMHDDDSKNMLVDCDITSIGVGAAMRGRTPYWSADTGRA